MVGIKNSYLLDFLINGKSFLASDDLISLSIYEKAGNTIPLYEITYKIRDPEILKYLNEKSTCIIKLGKNADSLKEIKVVISKLDVFRRSPEFSIIQQKGTIEGAVDYTSTHKISTHRGSGMSALTKVLSNNDKILLETSVKDASKQVWIQPNITDKQFVDNILEHLTLKDSVVLAAYSAEGKLKVKDLKSIARLEEIKAIFTADANLVNEKIHYFDGEAELSFNTGILNKWSGSNKVLKVYNIDDDGYKDATLNRVNSHLTGEELNISEEFGNRIVQTRMISENTHLGYWSAKVTNQQAKAVYSSSLNKISIANQYVDVDVLDLVTFIDLPKVNEKLSTDYYSGNYILTGYTLSYSKGTLITYLDMTRESINSLNT